MLYKLIINTRKLLKVLSLLKYTTCKALQIRSSAKPSGVVGNVLNCDIIVSEFELQSRYYINFRTATFGGKVWTHHRTKLSVK